MSVAPSELPGEVMEIQMGPSHPASHGTIKFNLRLDGETIIDVDIGYLHRGFEKMCEQGTWNHCFPYADRLNYASPILNNVGFALAVEKLARLTVPWCRLGGVMNDLPADMRERTTFALRQIRRILADCDRLLSRNRIFVD